MVNGNGGGPLTPAERAKAKSKSSGRAGSKRINIHDVHIQRADKEFRESGEWHKLKRKLGLL